MMTGQKLSCWIILFSLLLWYVQVVQSIQPKLNVTEMDILKDLYDSTGGSAGWNFISMETCDKNYAIPGQMWNFSKNAAGKYLYDPCYSATNLPFTGVNCTCDAFICTLETLAPICGNLTGSLPHSLNQLTNLQKLFFYNNSLATTIPMWLGSMTNLQMLDLSSNRFVGHIPSSIGQLANLKMFFLCSNDLSGPILPQLGLLTKLEILWLFNNSLTSSLPLELGYLQNLQELFVYDNFLTGSIPSEFEGMTSMMLLELSNNNFTGEIPASLSKLTNMQSLALQNNSLSSTISPELGLLTKMVLLNLGDNDLTGEVPPEVSNLKSLQLLLLSNNWFISNAATNSAISFFNPQALSNLTILDLSLNGFTGSIPQSIFELPSLEVFSAGSNCFSGSLPSNICNATSLQTLVISSLNTDSVCREYYWEGSAFSRYFNGFGAIHRIEGSLPQCIYSMPNMVTFHADGNSLSGNAPFSGENKSGLKISPVLRDLNIARNRLVGTISSELVTASASNKNLSSLDLSYNHIRGDLSIFAGSDGAYFKNVGPLVLQVNELSGDVPKSLLSMKNISILDGNLFGCSFDRKDLPENDYDLSSYQCGSRSMDTMLFITLLVVLVIAVFLFLWQNNDYFKRYAKAMKLWLDVAEGRQVIIPEIKITQTKRYFNYLRDMRWFVLMIGLASIVVLVVYVTLSGSSSRITEYTYTWITTAAYLTGINQIILVAVVALSVIGLTWYLVMQNMWDNLDTVNEDDQTEHEKKYTLVIDSNWMWIHARLSPLLRVVLLTTVVISALFAGNVLYLHALLYWSPTEQFLYKVFFAAFKLIWTMGVTPALFESEYLEFGLDVRHHDTFINSFVGSKHNLLFHMNVVSYFWIPLMTLAVWRYDCFYNVFFAADQIPVSFQYQRCITFDNVGYCIERGITTVNSNLDVPFVYNYSCASSLMRTYIPLYQQMVIMLICWSALQFGYLCFDINKIENRAHLNESPIVTVNVPDGCIRTMWIKLQTLWIDYMLRLPLRHLIYNSRERKALHKVGKSGVVFSSKTRIWITKRVPAHSALILILLTFGLLAPLLGMTIVLALVLDSYVCQLVLGRFLCTEMSVVQEYRRKNRVKYCGSYNPNELEISEARLASMQNDIDDAASTWGALAVLKEVESQCRHHLPASNLSLGRTAFVIIPSIITAFVMNDELNNIITAEVGKTHLWWPSIVIISIPCCVEICTVIYIKTCKPSSKKQHSNSSMTQSIDSKSMSEVGSIYDTLQITPRLSMIGDQNGHEVYEDWGIHLSEYKRDEVNPIHDSATVVPSSSSGSDSGFVADQKQSLNDVNNVVVAKENKNELYEREEAFEEKAEQNERNENV